MAKGKVNINNIFGGINIPIPQENIDETLELIDKDTGSILLPVKFRSTKHFTVNTPLEVTGDYNTVSLDRTYTIIDNIDSFLSKGYGYSVAYHDAYLDVSHESLPVSLDAVVLIEESKYDMKEISHKTGSTIKEFLRGQWFVFVCEKDKPYDFALSIVASNDFLTFSIGNTLFQICRLSE